MIKKDRQIPGGKPATGKGMDKIKAAADAKVEAMHRVLNCLQLRKGGASYRNIAQNLNISEVTARKNVVDEMRRITEDVQEAAKEHRQLQLERLNELLLAYWPRRSDPRVGALIMGVMAKQDALLGIVAEKIDLTVYQNEFEKMPTDALEAFLAKKMAALESPAKISSAV